MKFFYNILMQISEKFLMLFGNFFGNKIKLFVKGQKNIWKQLQNCHFNRPIIWFHVSSLGEYEQALPLLEAIKEKNKYQIVLSFFSPSGYEIVKNKKNPADCILYLAWDTRKNVKRFLDIINPTYVFFVKYDLWPNYLSELKKRQIKTYLISGIFTAHHQFFKPYNIWLKNTLKAFTHFFVQDENSKKILQNQGFKNVSVTGDTRFDRVYQIVQTPMVKPDFIRNFKDDKLLFVAGSTWQTGEELIADYLNNTTPDFKTVIAPHNISRKHIKNLLSKGLKNYILYSEITPNTDLKKYNILILNTIGLLNKVYRFSDWVYIGGGFGKSIHNIQEPAVFGNPILTGPKIYKFKEAVDLEKAGGLVVIKGKTGFEEEMKLLATDEKIRKQRGRIVKQYVETNLGATAKILNKLNL